MRTSILNSIFHMCHLRHLWILSLIVLSGCATQPTLERYEFTRLQMGVQAQIVLYAPIGEREAASGVAAAAFAEIARLEQIMSDYRPDSELMQLCSRAGGGPVAVSDDLFEILTSAQEISQLSGGAFDITVGPLSILWREARQQSTPPSESEIDVALARVGWQDVALNASAQTVQLHRPGMVLDLGGIAKGYAADRTVQLLKKSGFNRCLVALAGDIAVGDAPPGTDGWRIEVATRLTSKAIPNTLMLSNCCVSTSGDTEQFMDINGVRHSHIIDPRTGMGVTNQMIVTVVAPTGAMADGLSSAISVIGPFGFTLMEALESTAVIIETGNERHSTDHWRILKWEHTH